jgi:hypothetical protein
VTPFRRSNERGHVTIRRLVECSSGFCARADPRAAIALAISRTFSYDGQLVLHLLAAVALSLVPVLVLHEAGHAFAALALGGRAMSVRMRPRGAAVETQLATPTRALAFLLAGPLASALAGVALVALGGMWMVPGALSVAFGLMCLLPRGVSDGAQAWSLVRSLRS